MTPRYASAAALTIANMVVSSSTRQGRMLLMTPPSVVSDQQHRKGNPRCLERNCGERSGSCRHVSAWRDTELPNKRAGHVALIGEASVYRCVDDGMPGS